MDLLGAEATLVDRPDDERLTAARVAGGEHSVHRRRVVRSCGIAATRRARRPAARAAAARGAGTPSRAARARPGVIPPCPGSGANGGAPSFCAQWICSTEPFEPERCVVEIAKSRSPPSFSAYDVRSFIGHCGHGVRSSGRLAGGSPRSSIWVTEAAFSRCALATQSAPVSPPPITITCFPAAVIGRSSDGASSPAVPTSAAIARARS